MSGNYWNHKETVPPLDKMLLKISDPARCMGRRICTNVSWINKKHKSEMLNDRTIKICWMDAKISPRQKKEGLF